MNYNDDNYELTEEIYLTEEHAKYWLKLNSPRCHFFKYGSDVVALKNLCPNYDFSGEITPDDGISRMIISSLASVGYFDNHGIVILGDPSEGSSPKRIRKMKRHSETVWTLFRHNDLVIGVHDDGTIIAREIDNMGAHEYRITPPGRFYCNGREQQAAALSNLVTTGLIIMIRKGFRTWVQQGKGRKTPMGLQRLWRSLKKVAEVDFLWKRISGPM
jgi:hypothetical protein